MSSGVVDRARIAVGGHSYGAFMAANLLAHAGHLFACGVAQSGAYNRTLTPFGFQVRNHLLASLATWLLALLANLRQRAATRVLPSATDEGSEF